MGIGPREPYGIRDRPLAARLPIPVHRPVPHSGAAAHRSAVGEHPEARLRSVPHRPADPLALEAAAAVVAAAAAVAQAVGGIDVA